MLLLAPLVELAPVPRDMADYFIPMRQYSADHLLWHDPAWINLDSGCGEAWFANPQTGMLYPPHWLYAALPTQWAVTCEVALHLCLLAMGVGRLVARWGADLWGRVAAETAAWSCGPVVVSVGVVNNLETAAWIPWVVLAAQGRSGRSVALTAATSALAWLGGEPQVWALGMALTVVCAARPWRAVLGVALGVGVVAVQLVSFVLWVLEGDRGAGSAAAFLEGAVTPVHWLGVILPGPGVGGDVVAYAPSLFLGAPLLACALIAASVRLRRFGPVLLLAAMAMLPLLHRGELYAVLTGGMVRYPARFAMVALVCMVPLVGLGVGRWRQGEGSMIAAVVGGVTLLVCAIAAPSRTGWLIAGLPAVILVGAASAPRARWLRDLALVLGLVACVAAGLPLLGLGPLTKDQGRSWTQISSGGRLHTPAVAGDLRRWVDSGMTPRWHLAAGYLNLAQGVSTTRTYAPLAHHRLTEHLGQSDRGPAFRWWLDTLGARWVVMRLESNPDEMLRTARRGGLCLLRNLRSLPVVSVAEHPPDARQAWKGAGAVVVLSRSTNRIAAAITAPRAGWAWLSLTPVRGWTWRLDGKTVALQQGPGILQTVSVPAGEHRLEGRYRPPALGVSIGISLLSVVGVCYLVWPGRRRSRQPFDSGEV